MTQDFRENALEYHRQKPPGKLEVTPTKPLATQRDLALAYSPGVAAACDVIVDDPRAAAGVTARGNLIGVVTNGTAVLGLGAIGPLASKPVMEGKAVLFKKFAGVDVFDIEIDERDPDRLVDIIASLEPTFGGINLEDIKSPECFEVEERLKARMGIPVFHDDQHGTAIVTAAAIRNGLRLVDKDPGDARLVCSGAGAAAIACLELLVALGFKSEHITVIDLGGVLHPGRSDLHPRQAAFARETGVGSLAEAIEGADVFLGLSAPGVLKRGMVATMARDPLILAMANPVPEILPEEAQAERPDCIMATGRSDYPNQVNNVLCFPFIFRGALDVGASAINETVKLACVEAIADLALEESSDVVASAYGDQNLAFGRDYLIPKPFDPRLIVRVAPAVARAAMDSGVAVRPIADLDAYRRELNTFVFQTALVMKPVFERARRHPRRVVYAEGEHERVLRAVQAVVDDSLARPIVIGRRSVVSARIQALGLRLRLDEDVALVDPEDDPRYREYWTLYHRLMERRGVTPDHARTVVRTNATVIAALMVHRQDADALIAGLEGRYHDHLAHVEAILGRRAECTGLSAMNALIHTRGTLFLTDTYVNHDPGAHAIAESACLAAAEVRRFGIKPKLALLSHSSFGASNAASARKMREALTLIRDREPGLEVEGEMHGDAALSEALRERIFPNSALTGSANLLVMPTLDAANIAFNLLKAVTGGVSIGPVLLGAGDTAHVVTPSITVRGLINMTALAGVEADVRRGAGDAGMADGTG